MAEVLPSARWNPIVQLSEYGTCRFGSNIVTLPVASGLVSGYSGAASMQPDGFGAGSGGHTWGGPSAAAPSRRSVGMVIFPLPTLRLALRMSPGLSSIRPVKSLMPRRSNARL